MKKKRTKKYNPTLAFQKVGKNYVKHFQILDITNVGIWTYRQFIECKIDKVVASALNEIRHKWQIMAGVICVDKFGDKYIKTDMFITKDDYFTKELSDYLNDAQIELWNNANPAQRLNLFWIATPNKEEISKDWLLDELIKKGAFNHRIDEIKVSA